jgi:hypothetical protein
VISDLLTPRLWNIIQTTLWSVTSGNTDGMISQGEVRVARLTHTYRNLKTAWHVNFSQRWRFILGLPGPVDGGIRLPPTPGQLTTSQMLIVRPNTTCRSSTIVFYHTLQQPVAIAHQSWAPYKIILNWSSGILVNRKKLVTPLFVDYFKHDTIFNEIAKIRCSVGTSYSEGPGFRSWSGNRT